MAHSRQAGVIQGLALTLPVTTSVMGSAILAPNIPLMIQHFHDLPNVGFWVPAMVTVPSLLLAICSPLAGMVADALGRRRVMLGAMLIYGLVGMAPLLVKDFWPLFATRILVGVTEAFIMTSSSVLIGDYFSGRRRDHWLAMQTTVASFSSILMFPLGGLVGSVFGWQYVFGMYGFSLVLLPLVLFTTWEPEQMARVARKALPWGRVILVSLVAAAAAFGVVKLFGVAAPLVIYVAVLAVMAVIGLLSGGKSQAAVPEDGSSWAGFPWLRLTGTCLVTAVGSIMFYLLQINLAQVLAEAGVNDPAKVGLYIALTSIGIVLGTFIFSVMSRTPVSILLLVEFTMIAVGFYGMSHAPSFTVLIAFAALNQLGCGLLLPTLFTWTVRQFSFAQRGRGVGIWQGFFNGGQFVGVSFLAIMVAAFTGGPITPAFGYIAVISAIVAAGALVALLLGKGAKPVVHAPDAAEEGASVALH